MQEKQINNPCPLWTKKPEYCTAEEYIEFYQKAFHDLTKPAYWIHLFDETLGIKGIIYFKSEETMNRSGVCGGLC